MEGNVSTSCNRHRHGYGTVIGALSIASHSGTMQEVLVFLIGPGLNFDFNCNLFETQPTQIQQPHNSNNGI